MESGAWGEKIISIGFSVLCAVVGTTVFVWGWPPSSFMPMSRTSAAVGFQQTTQRMPLVLRSILYTFCVCGQGFAGSIGPKKEKKWKAGCFNEE